MLGKFSKLLAVAVTSLTVSSVSHAAIINLTATADGDVQTFGGDSVNTTSNRIAITQSGGLIRNGIFEFDLSAVDDGATINSVTFSVMATRFVSNTPSNPTSAVHLFGYNGDGVVNIDDYDASATQIYSSTVPTGGVDGDLFSFTLTDFAPVADALLGNLFTIRFETDSFASFNFASIDDTSFDYLFPSLSIDYTVSQTNPNPNPDPVSAPAMAGFLSLALGGIFLRNRRKA
ncbi:hypothetical protein [Glaciecola sp. 1036]|uniref:hypothetical protein n=1 Tax=Alteromonadaceae TaxID=72275 RepID=UPI003CFF5051